MKKILNVCGAAYASLIVIFLLLPAFAVLPASIGRSEFIEFPPKGLTASWYWQVFSDTSWLESGLLSLRMSVLAAILTTLVAVLFGIVHVRRGDVPRWSMVLVFAPLWVPHVVLASGVFALFMPSGFVGSEYLLATANSVLALPLSVTFILASFGTIDPNLWVAAASMGARPITILRTVVLPLAALGTVMSLVLAFQSAWDETTFALFIGPVMTPVLSAKMYAYASQAITPVIAAVSSIVTGVTLVATLAFGLLRSRSVNKRG